MCSVSADRNGQAMVEVIIGLVALMALLAGILQVASLTKAQTDCLGEARGRAGAAAMSPPLFTPFPDYITDIDVGNDGRSYSTDDDTTLGNEADFKRAVVDQTAGEPTDWDTLDALPKSPMSGLRSSAQPVQEFGLVEGTASRTIPLLSAVQKLLYADDEIEVRSRVWMTKTEDIY